MYPALRREVVSRETTLKNFLSKLGKEYLYAFNRGVLGVWINGKPGYPSYRLKKGDEVLISPVIAGG